MMNQKKAPTKISNMMNTLNKLLYSVFLFQFLILVTWSTMSVIWMNKNKDTHLYLDIQGSVDTGRWFLQYITYQVAYSHMIPISLYVIIEMLKLCLSNSINRDVKMFFADEEDMNYAKTMNSDLIEELGQVEFVFSDKTGTLTQNKMEFKKCHISDTLYGDLDEQEIELGVTEYIGMVQSSVNEVQRHLQMYTKYQEAIKNKTKRMFEQQNNMSELEMSEKIYHFFRLLAVCHTVVVE